jgi:hypothetical protein
MDDEQLASTAPPSQLFAHEIIARIDILPARKDRDCKQH